EADRCHCARGAARSTGADHAGVEGHRRRLRHHAARGCPRRKRFADLPRSGDDIDGMGRCRLRHHRHCPACARGRSREVRTAMSDDFVLEARNLTKRYGDTAAVNGINLSVRKGETFGLLGPNGAGKTTTILMLLGLSEVTEGTARVLALDPVRAPLAVKRRVGYLPDSVGFYDNLTADENLRYTARLMQIPAAERGRRIGAALERVGLADVTHKRVGAFSRGMRQRLGIAELLMKRAEIVILDEPTSGLDPQATMELLAIIRGLKSDGVTVMLSSHLLDQVQSICDRVALFNAGQIALAGTVPELARQVLGGGYVVEIEAEGTGLVSE